MKPLVEWITEVGAPTCCLFGPTATGRFRLDLSIYCRYLNVYQTLIIIIFKETHHILICLENCLNQ